MLNTGLARGAYAGFNLARLEDTDLTCGIRDLHRTLQEFSIFQHMAQVDFTESIDTHPDFLTLKACELGVALNTELACIILSGVTESEILVLTIEQLVLAITSRLKLTKTLLTMTPDYGDAFVDTSKY